MLAHEVWVVDDDSSIRWVLERAMTQAGYECRVFAAADEVIERLDVAKPAVVLTDLRMPQTGGLALLSVLAERLPDTPVIVMTAHSDLDSAVSSYQAGAFEYLPKPFDVDDVVSTVSRAIALGEERARAAEDAPPTAEGEQEIIGKAPAMQEVFRAIGRLSQSNITVMIEGASGTGKELVARALHTHSPRARRAFVALNMAAIPHDLIESELFGHERGAFTGARDQRIGRFEQADGGTLFLDEIGDMPADAQTRLLRVLAEGEFYRVGGRTSVRTDVRIITATHRDLAGLVAEGSFREDLYHRLNVIRVHVPPLAKRATDIPMLAADFLARAARNLGGEAKVILPETMDFLQSLPWPGNVRQLENTCNWLTVMAPGREIHITDLPPELTAEHDPNATQGDWETLLRTWLQERLARGDSNILKEAMPAFETTLIRTTLEHTGGRKRDAALLLGWGRNTLTRKLAELGLKT